MVNEIERINVFLIVFVEYDLIVKMWARTHTSISNKPNYLAAFYSLAFFNFDAVQVTVSSREINFLRLFL
jgi:hypothetical protein